MRLERSRRLVVSLSLGMALSLGTVLPSAAASSPPPATLSGEQFTVPSDFGAVGCTSTGPFSFSVSGTATGPYTGTFTEAVTGTVSPPPVTRTISALTATFTIHSPTGDVTGTKTLSGSGPTACYQDANNVVSFGPVPTTY